MTHRLLVGIQLKLLDGVEYGTVIMKTECIIIAFSHYAHIDTVLPVIVRKAVFKDIARHLFYAQRHHILSLFVTAVGFTEIPHLLRESDDR